jgi:pimeloyl-ACP methyl ester carboxylesterase
MHHMCFKKKIVGAVAVATLFASVAAMADDDLLIRKMGSMEAGGKVVVCDTIDGGSSNTDRHFGGQTVVDNVYSTYLYPANQRYAYPILFNSGGGHTGRFYDTTPDGREGWLTLFAREGFATYGVDRVNAGRSGSDVCQINAVRLGKAPIATLPTLNRYSSEAAWKAFRWGPKFGVPYPNTQFPIEAVNNYYPQMVTTYRDPDEVPKSVEAFSALIDKIGTPVVLQSWSSSAVMIYLTAAARADKVKGLLAIESSTSSFDNIPPDARKKLAKVPIIIVIGDHAQDRIDASRKFQKEMAAIGGDVTVDVLPEAGIYGNGHTMALEKNNKQIMFRLIAWMEGHVYNAGAAKAKVADNPKK